MPSAMFLPGEFLDGQRIHTGIVGQEHGGLLVSLVGIGRRRGTRFVAIGGPHHLAASS